MIAVTTYLKPVPQTEVQSTYITAVLRKAERLVQH
jgi:hypothetical protein